jgi:hypothetical protein
MKANLLVLILCLSVPLCYGQEEKKEKKRNSWYFAGGYNLDWFSKSDIHFKDNSGPYYDFTLYDVKAVDRPGLKNLFHQNITIPQYSFRFGVYFNDKHNLGFEVNYDHVKYVMLANQKVRLSGSIADKQYDTDTIISSGLLTYEHTNGANFCLFNLIKRWNLWQVQDYRFALHAIVKPGIGFVFPRSDVTIFGVNRNDTYHVAGYVAGTDAGLRFNFFRNFFLDTSLKASFANYTKVLLPGKGRANQHFFAYEYIFTAGIQFGK